MVNEVLHLTKKRIGRPDVVLWFSRRDRAEDSSGVSTLTVEID